MRNKLKEYVRGRELHRRGATVSENADSPGRVVLYDADAKVWLDFQRPLRVLAAHEAGDVIGVLDAVERGVNEEGLHAAGFLSYEAAPAFDTALTVRRMTDFPLAWFGLYGPPKRIALPDSSAAPMSGEWTPTLTEEEYCRAVQRIREFIRAGDTYQVNYSIRLRRAFTSDPWSFFTAWVRGGAWPCAAFADTGRFALCSASPELFFELHGGEIRSRPMKGTAQRGPTTAQDRGQADLLRESAKNRAENVMIVDMVRNDLGRICEPDSVKVEKLFDVERYPSLWQMTSTIKGRTLAGLTDIFRALFPPASITGAPKPRTMQIIAESETSPRRIYTGCMGFLAPGRTARFNVAIRTVLADRARGEAEYGVGGGIVWDSTPESEWAECRTKSRTVTEEIPCFLLIETMLWTPGEGYGLLEEHLNRLADSAAYFDYPLNMATVRAALEEQSGHFGDVARKVRLLVSDTGEIQVESCDPPPVSAPAARVCLARRPVDSADRFLYHKTTHRRVYEERREECGAGVDDVILWNERGEVTETTIANIVVELDGRRVTPPVECGLLAGTFRRRLLEARTVEERRVRVEDLARCSHLWLVNSVRGWREAVLERMATSAE